MLVVALTARCCNLRLATSNPASRKPRCKLNLTSTIYRYLEAMQENQGTPDCKLTHCCNAMGPGLHVHVLGWLG